MFTLTDLVSTGVLSALWRECSDCGRLFPAAPDQTRCPACMFACAGWS